MFEFRNFPRDLYTEAERAEMCQHPDTGCGCEMAEERPLMGTYSTNHRGEYNGPKFGPLTMRSATAADYARLASHPHAIFRANLAAKFAADDAAREARENAILDALIEARMAR